MTTMWSDPIYRETAAVILGFLGLLSLIVYFVKNSNAHALAAWASLKSWFFVAPMLLVMFALPKPWPLFILILVSIYSAKTFFQMVGMYHRSWFVWSCYLGMMALGYSISEGWSKVYDMLPMLLLGAISLIPLARNSARHMIQYIALTLLAYIFFGWSFLHLARFLSFDNGVFIVLYLYILTEVSDSASMTVNRFSRRVKLFSKISNRVTLEGIIGSLVISLLLAWGMRHLLPDRSEQFWIAAAVSAAIFGRLGDLILSVIRRDLGIKPTGIFIIGRGDILGRVDKLIFVGPIYYYTYLYLQAAS